MSERHQAPGTHRSSWRYLASKCLDAGEDLKLDRAPTYETRQNNAYKIGALQDAATGAAGVMLAADSREWSGGTGHTFGISRIYAPLVFFRKLLLVY